MVGCLRKINCKNFVSRWIICKDYSKYDPEILCIDIKNSNINLTDQFKNVNKAWGHFYASLLNIVNNNAPIIGKKVKGKPNPWITSELIKKRTNLINAWENAKMLYVKLTFQFENINYFHISIAL